MKLCFESKNFFITVNKHVRSQQRAEKGSVIESTVIPVSEASLSVIKHRLLVVMGDSLSRAVSLDQTDMLP